MAQIGTEQSTIISCPILYFHPNYLESECMGGVSVCIDKLFGLYIKIYEYIIRDRACVIHHCFVHLLRMTERWILLIGCFDKFEISMAELMNNIKKKIEKGKTH